jgi:AraC-like DNA-binding protein
MSPDAAIPSSYLCREVSLMHRSAPTLANPISSLVSASHFLRQFKLRFGCPPHAYVLQRRLVRARDLLTKSRESIKVVAARSGFADQSHMTRAFQRHLRVTPRLYRESVGRRASLPSD